MKILLVRPAGLTNHLKAFYDVIVLESLPLEYVGAGVSSEHDVRIFDMTLEGGVDGLKETVRTFKPNIVGTTALTCEAPAAVNVHQYVKEINEDILTVAGGMHATMSPETYFTKYIDLVVIGEGVFAFKEIVSHFEREVPFDDILGIAINKGDHQHKTPPRPMYHPDDLPLPDRSLTKHIRHHYCANVWATDIALVRSTVGCPFRCDFCICWKLAQGLYLKRDVEAVVNEICNCKEHFIFFTDDEFMLDTERAMSIARRLKEEGVKKEYFMFGRADTIVGHPALIEAWKELGLIEMFVGIEAPSDEELARHRKGSDQNMNNECIRTLREHDVTCLSSMIADVGYELDDFKRMYDWCVNMELESPVFQISTPIPGTDFYAQVENKITTHDWNLFDYQHIVLPTKLDMRTYYEEFGKLWLYHQMPVPADHHKGVLEKAGRDPESIWEAVGKMRRFEDAMCNLYQDHEIYAQSV